MPAKISLISQLQVDPALAQTAANTLDAGERQYIDDQVRGTQQHVVDSIVGGTLCTWRVVDLSSPTLGRGDVVCLVGEYVTLATAAAVAAAGGVAFGIVMASAAPGTAVRIAVGGFVKSTITGLSAASGFAVLNQTTGRLIGKTAIDQGDIALGVTNAAGVLTLSIDYPRAFGFKTLLSGAGDEAALSFAYTVNKPSGNDDGLVVSMTDTASPGTSRVVAVKVGGSYVFYVDPNGSLQWPGSGAAAAAGNLSLTSGGYVQVISTGVIYFGSSGGGSPQFIWRGVGDALVRTDTMPHGGACTVLWAATVTSVTYKVDDAAAATAGKQMIFQAGRAGATGARSAGGDITVNAGAASGDSGSAAKGGGLFAAAGQGSSSDGAGGDVNITGGAGGASNGNGGAVFISGGGKSGTGIDGNVTVGPSGKGMTFRRRTVQTGDATATTIGEVIPIADNTTVIIRCAVTGDVNGSANSAGFTFDACVKRTGGGVATLVGASTPVLTGENDASWDAFVDVDGGNNARVRVKGAAATTVDWTENTIICT